MEKKERERERERERELGENELGKMGGEREEKLCLFSQKKKWEKNGKKKKKTVVDPDRPEAVDLRDVRVVAKLGGTVDDSELVDGLVFDQRSARGAGGPTRVENAKIALIQFCLSPPKTDLDNSVVVSDYAAMDRVLRDERNHVLG